ncbi:MAG: 30S ribosomal protein S12 methylthiotransferase RimO [Myxococcales bacterium]|nr:30S ribosomal protein S12 methylthiotransferase RimO [Myxococcales bacterium]
MDGAPSAPIAPLAPSAPAAPLAGRRIHLVSLGCPKNRVDSELLLGQAVAAGWELTARPEDAGLLVVNTCAFLQDSVKESVDVILALGDIKAAHPGAKLVVAGCLSQRHAADLGTSLPEVDAFLGTGEYGDVAGRLGLRDPAGPLASGVVVGATKKPRPAWLPDHLEPRFVAPDSFTTYLKIAEGCSQGCTFCIIPKLRGPQRSRAVADCVAEARQLVARGVVELCLVAQDLTHYGEDFGDPDALAKLVRALGAVEGLRWVRLMYAYPHNVTDALVMAIAETENCCKYIDMPLQHAADPVLKAMGRLHDRRSTEALLERLFARVPGLVFRTTLLVGHPGETERDFAELLDFVRAWRLHRVGCFAYSREDGTLAARQAGQLPTAVKKARQSELMGVQATIAAAHQRAMIGREVEVLVEGLSDETDLLLQGRTQGQAPDIDGVVYLNDAPADIGRAQMRRVRITEAHTHDLVGCVVG